MPDDKVPISEFAAKIKAKYPEYKDVNDTLLTQKIIEKYPEYKDMVDYSPETIKKKDISSTPSNAGGQVGTSGGQLAETDPVKQILEPLRNDYADKAGKYLQVQQNKTDVLTPHGQPLVEKISDAQPIAPSEYSQAKIEHNQAANKLVEAHNVVKKTLFKNGNDAKNYLENKPTSFNQNNETDQLAIQRSDEYDKVYNDYQKTHSIAASAINEMMEQDPNFADQVKAANGRIPPVLEGKAIDTYIQNHKADLDEISKHDRTIGSDYEDLRDNLITRNPQYGENVIANKISEEREKRGYNSSIANFNTSTYQKHNDEIANKILNKQELDLYNKNKEDVGSMINTGGFLNRAGESIESGLMGTKHLLQSSFGALDNSSDAYNNLKNQYSGVSSGETGWKKTLGNMGSFAGTLAYMGAGGELGIPSKVMTPLAFGDPFIKEGEEKYPNNKAKALLSGYMNTIAMSVLPDIYPAGKVKEAFKDIKPELNKVIENLGENESATSLRSKLSDAFHKAAIQPIKGATEMGGLTYFNQKLDKALGLQNYQKYHPDTEVGDVMKDMAIANILPGGIMGAGELLKGRSEPIIKPEEVDQPQIENKPEISPEQKVIQSAIDNGEVKGAFGDMAKEAVKTPENAKLFLDDVKDQATNKHDVGISDEQALSQAKNGFGENLVNAALENKEQPATEEKPRIIVSAAELEAAQPKEGTETDEQIQNLKPEQTSNSEGNPPVNPEVQQEGTEGNKVGVSHKSLTELGKKLGFEEPERGKYLSPEWYADRGRKLLAAGADPNEVNNPNNELHDRISIARAHLENISKEADQIAKNNPEGINSDEYKEAAKKASDYAVNVVKKLGTLGHRAFESLQGERDIDTDSFTNVKRAAQEKSGVPTSKIQDEKIKSLTDENVKLKKQTEDLEQKLVEATNKHIGEEGKKTNIKEKAKATAQRLRDAAKIHRPGSFSAATPASLVWDASVEVVAKSIEAGGTIAQAISDGIAHMQKTEWYKKLKDDDKKKAEKEFTDWHNEESEKIGAEDKEEIKDRKAKSGEARSKMGKPLMEHEIIEQDEEGLKQLQNKFINKTSNKFSPTESKEIWDYAKKNYLDNGISYRDMISNVSNDLGLSWRQVSDAITTPKVKAISDAMWKKQAEYRRGQIATKNWIADQDKTKGGKLLNKISGAFRGVSVFGHGGIFVGTHAGMNLFKPSTWKYVIPAFVRGWKFAYGNKGDYERKIQELKNSPNYVLAQRAGLQNNPERINLEEYQKSQKFLGKLGLAGERGFNAIKVLRQNLFDYHYNHLKQAEKADPETAKQIAHLVNNATGATNVAIPKWVDEVTFAGRMEAARWEKLTSNPLKATSTAMKAIFTPSKASVSDRVFAKVWAKRVGEQLATFTGLLAANAGLQYAINPKNPVNYTDPTKPDFMKFKFGDETIDPTSGMRGALMFAYGVGKIPFMSKKELRGDTRMQSLGKSTATYARGKLAPFYSTMADFYTQQDFNKNPLPFSNDKPSPGHHKLTWGEYAWQHAPLPVAEAANAMYKSAEENGADKMTLNNVLDGVVSGGISMGTGFRAGEYNAEKENTKHSPFTDDDKKDPTFKYFLDKGLDLPNTVKSSEKVPHSGGKSVSDLSKDVQDKYDSVHKELLKKELNDVVKKGYVHINADGNVAASGKKVKFDELTDDQKHQVLHNAQAAATRKTKEKLFKK